MGSIESERPTDDADVDELDDLELDEDLRGPEPDNKHPDDVEETEQHTGVLGAVSKLGDLGVGAVAKVGDPIVELIGGAKEEDDEPVLAELVDGVNVYFIDKQGRRKSLYEYDLVVLDAPQYPEPAILKADRDVEIPKGSILSAADSMSALSIGGKRVLVRPCILVEPDRADDVQRDHLVEFPEELVGATIERREVQATGFYEAVLQGFESS